MLSPISAVRDREADVKTRILLHDVSAEPLYLHAEAKFTYPCDFASIVDALNASIRAVRAHMAQTKDHVAPTDTLLQSKSDQDDR